jgi:hypothetical protein
MQLSSRTPWRCIPQHIKTKSTLDPCITIF